MMCSAEAPCSMPCSSGAARNCMKKTKLACGELWDIVDAMMPGYTSGDMQA